MFPGTMLMPESCMLPVFFFFFSEMYDYASDIPIPSLEVCLLAC